MTIFVMHVYKHAQPALLYLVPACLGECHQPFHVLMTECPVVGVPLFLALVRGDIQTMFQYEDHPDLDSDKKSK